MTDNFLDYTTINVSSVSLRAAAWELPSAMSRDSVQTGISYQDE